jgi:hypothetical protein
MRATIRRAALAVVISATVLSGCGDSLVGPDLQEPAGPVTGDIAIRLPGPMSACPDRPQNLINEVFPVRVRTLRIHDDARDRDVPIDVILPLTQGSGPPVFGRGPFPVVVFSHGGTPYDRRDYTAETDPILPEFTQYWASKGYVVLAPRHRRFPREEWSQPDRTRDITITLDHALQLVRTLDPDVFIDLEHTVMAGFSIGATTAVLIAGMTLPSGPDGNGPVDFTDDRFASALVMTGATSEIEGNTWWRPDWSGLTLPVLSLVGSEDLNNEAGTVPDDFFDVVRESPRGGKHGVLVIGAGHYLGAQPWDTEEELNASQTASVMFLRAYADPPNDPAIVTLAHRSFCGLVDRDMVEVEYHNAPLLGGI